MVLSKVRPALMPRGTLTAGMGHVIRGHPGRGTRAAPEGHPALASRDEGWYACEGTLTAHHVTGGTLAEAPCPRVT